MEENYILVPDNCNTWSDQLLFLSVGTSAQI